MLCISFVVIVNADSEDDSRYTIVLQSTTDEDKVYSATAEMDDTNNSISAYFGDITADTYNILVYYLNVERGNNSLCKSTQWTSEAKDGEKDAIKVDYSIDSEEINVMVTAIHNSVDYDTTADEDAIVTDDTTVLDNTAVINDSTIEESSTGGIYIIILIAFVVLIILIAKFNNKNLK
jgi:hypothetical protein